VKAVHLAQKEIADVEGDVVVVFVVERTLKRREGELGKRARGQVLGVV